jgi:hypothetical protein
VRASIALITSDRPSFEKYYARVKAIYSRGGHPGLIAKLQRLSLSAQKRDPRGRIAVGQTQRSWTYETVVPQLTSLSRVEQFDYLLALLLREADVHAGHLYAGRPPNGYALVATKNTYGGDVELEDQVCKYAAMLLDADEETTRSLTASESSAFFTRVLPEYGIEHYTIVALRTAGQQLCGLVLLRIDPEGDCKGCDPGLCALVADVLERLC